MSELWTNLRLRWRALWKRRQLEQDLADEIAFHVAMREGDTRNFGNPARVKEDLRDMWTFQGVETFWQDVRYAARMLWRSPLFTLVAVGSLAIGIGANTAIFSLVNAVMLKSLPVPDPQDLRLVLWTGNPRVPMKGRSGYSTKMRGIRVDSSVSYPLYELLAGRMKDQYDLMGFARGQVTVLAGGESHYASALFTSGNMSTVLGVTPQAGRLLSRDDDRVGAPPVALVTHAYWERRFGLDPNVVGRDVTMNGQRVTVVGVLPRGFTGLDPGYGNDFVLAISQIPAFGPKFYEMPNAERWWVQMLARLRPGVSPESARSALEALMTQIDQSYPDKRERGKAPWKPVVEEGAGGIPLMRMQAETPMLVLGAVVGLVLLIACANIANLLLARGAARRREVAVRLSIGAGRWRLIRQFLTESLMLASAGAVLGLFLAAPLARACLSLSAGNEPLPITPTVDGRALLFTAVATVLTAMLFGLAPALRATRVDLTPALKDGGNGARGLGGHTRLSRALVMSQVALCVMLLTGAGLFMRTLSNLTNLNPGFNPRQLLIFSVDASRSGYEEARLTGLYERIRLKLGEIPGVQAVTLSSTALISNSMSNSSVYLPGEKYVAGKERGAYQMHVGSNFLSVMGIRLLEGRDISERDTPTSPRTAVVNEAFVKEFFGGRSAIGKQFTTATPGKDKPEPPIEIVGVCGNAKYDNLKREAPATFYVPFLQDPTRMREATFEVRSAMPVGSLAGAVRAVVAGIDRNVPVADLRSQEEQIRLSLGMERMFASLVGGFGVTAALLAAIGLYGLLAYAVARRKAEIAIRLALGAGQFGVQWMVVRDSLIMAIAGLAVGVPAAFALSGLVKKLLYGVEPADPLNFVAAGAAMLAVAGAAAWLPARSAAKVDPAKTLRCE
ncbi:MAG TPA: ABC transporter permease [Paludibaculum sp.]|jgi:predicted permease